jgi:C1A family cysteine protease
MRSISKIGRRYGWKPQLPHFNDKLFKAQAGVILPPAVDLTEQDTPIMDQGSLGSCTAHALAGTYQFLKKKETGSFFNVSRLFIYYNERVIEGDVDQDGGAQIRDGIQSLNKTGVCPETDWAYDVAQFAALPPTSAYTDALKNEITSYEMLQSLQDMKACLASGYPFAFGFTVYDFFESDEMVRTGMLQMPTNDSQCLGGHAVCCVGYDDTKKAAKIRNSWGPDWGPFGGYFWMPYAYLANQNLTSDAWKISK